MLNSDTSTQTSRAAPKRAICRHSSEPIEPPAPVTSTVWPENSSARPATSSATGARPSRSSSSILRGPVLSACSHSSGPRQRQQRDARLGREQQRLAALGPSRAGWPPARCRAGRTRRPGMASMPPSTRTFCRAAALRATGEDAHRQPLLRALERAQARPAASCSEPTITSGAPPSGAGVRPACARRRARRPAAGARAAAAAAAPNAGKLGSAQHQHRGRCEHGAQ
jgi:hypothetical protein